MRRLNSADFSNPYNGCGFPDLRSVSELTVEILRGTETRGLRYRFR